MGKRSEFERRERDYYPTPPEAVAPLLAHLAPRTTFIEPCAGDGALCQELERNGHLLWNASDIEPRAEWIKKEDALSRLGSGDGFKWLTTITNPPWSREIMHQIIQAAIQSQRESWFLIDADWMHTRQSAALMKHCRKIVSVGRVKWIPGSKSVGKDNCCWYLFTDANNKPALFYGR